MHAFSLPFWGGNAALPGSYSLFCMTPMLVGRPDTLTAAGERSYDTCAADRDATAH